MSALTKQVEQLERRSAKTAMLVLFGELTEAEIAERVADHTREKRVHPSRVNVVNVRWLPEGGSVSV